MSDDECVLFLRKALPRARLRWAGYRKVRRQVCKRIRGRQRELGIDGFDAYADFLSREPAEAEVFDALCWIPISRFYRDRGVFDFLRERVFPALAEHARRTGRTEIRCWSAGCASGEEPYTLSIMWRMKFRVRHPALRFSVLATDADETMLARARDAQYPPGCLKDLPDAWIDAFTKTDGGFALREVFRDGVTFDRQDIRRRMPEGPFDLVLCRNLAFTYFDDEIQRATLSGLVERIEPGGFLVIGKHESLPRQDSVVSPVRPELGIFRKPAGDDIAAGGIADKAVASV